MIFDYLVVGAGLFGSTFAHFASKAGKKVFVIDKRPHIGGNIYTEKVAGITMHRYGAHIFHTSDEEVWKFINQFAEFNDFINSPIANHRGSLYNLPFNMNTFSELWGVTSPKEAKEVIDMQIQIAGIKTVTNLEEQALSLVGYDIYEKFIKHYTEKQWGKKCMELSPDIIKRLPLRFTFDNNYFNDKYQGIPIGGYTQIIEKMLKNCFVELNAKMTDSYKNIAKKIIYTGSIDEFFDYRLGKLEYRSLEFKHKILNEQNFQGVAVMNFTDNLVPYTRLIEHKHFEFGQQDRTIITYEYPQKWNGTNERFYPINNVDNDALYKKYVDLSKEVPNVIFGGRLGEYKYYDMDKTIKSAINLAKKELKE